MHKYSNPRLELQNSLQGPSDLRLGAVPWLLLEGLVVKLTSLRKLVSTEAFLSNKIWTSKGDLQHDALCERPQWDQHRDEMYQQSII